jgi:hypothetical protein
VPLYSGGKVLMPRRRDLGSVSRRTSLIASVSRLYPRVRKTRFTTFISPLQLSYMMSTEQRDRESWISSANRSGSVLQSLSAIPPSIPVMVRAQASAYLDQERGECRSEVSRLLQVNIQQEDSRGHEPCLSGRTRWSLFLVQSETLDYN